MGLEKISYKRADAEDVKHNLTVLLGLSAPVTFLQRGQDGWLYSFTPSIDHCKAINDRLGMEREKVKALAEQQPTSIWALAATQLEYKIPHGTPIVVKCTDGEVGGDEWGNVDREAVVTNLLRSKGVPAPHFFGGFTHTDEPTKKSRTYYFMEALDGPLRDFFQADYLKKIVLHADSMPNVAALKKAVTIDTPNVTVTADAKARDFQLALSADQLAKKGFQLGKEFVKRTQVARPPSEGLYTEKPIK